MNTAALIRPKTKQNYLKKHKYCKCGNLATSVDHIIPCHIFSIMCDYEMSFRDAVRDTQNWQPMCKKCNSDKNATFSIRSIPRFLYLKYKDIIDTYLEIRHNLYIESGGRCSHCKKQITEEECTVFLKDHRYVASEENGYLLCANCMRTGKRNKRIKR